MLFRSSELEAERHKAISLEFELAGEKRKLEEVQQACTTANERWEEAMTNNEELRDQAVKDKEETNGRMAAYPDLCMVAVEQFKRFADFQMAIDVAVPNSLAKKGDGGAGPSGVAAGGRSEEEVIQSF